MATASHARDRQEMDECFRCPICNSADISTFITIEELPIHCSALFATAADAQNTATGRISLAYCHRCSFVCNRQFEPDSIAFEPGYTASLAHTATFRAYVQRLVRRLIDRYELRNKSVLEIGCGDGYFLRQLCSFGKNEGFGIDPTLKQELTECVDGGHVQLIPDYFSHRYQHLISDFICSMSVFETVPNPHEFLTDLREMIGDRDEVIVYFEVPSSAYMFDKGSTWSIYYEQFGHFTHATLADLFRRCGYQVLESGVCYEGGQYAYVEAKSGTHRDPQIGSRVEERHELPEALKAFADAHTSNVKLWQRRLHELSTVGKKIMAWGSGGKASSFLNLLSTETLIHYVVDINPERHGRFIPGSAQEIVAPDFVAEYQPDVMIITNPIYEREIRKQVSGLGVACEFTSI